MEDVPIILYVEDDVVDQIAFRRFAESGNLNMEYEVVGTIEDAVNMVNNRNVQIIISDFNLGINTVFDLIKRINNIPFIVVTGAGDQEKAVNAMKAGAFDYLIKDPDGNHLQTIPVTIEKALKHKKDQEELEQYRKHLEELVRMRTNDLELEIERRKKRELEQKRQNEEIAALNEELTATNEALRVTNDELTKALIKAEEADKLKNAFLANLSHEIRTPLNSIMGFTSLLENDIDAEERQMYIEIVKSSSNQLLSIISDIIDIAKIEVGQMRIKYEKCSLNQIMDDLYLMFKTEKRLKEKEQVDLLLRKDLLDERSIIITDKVRLNQILLNLLNNALKFTDKGMIEFGYEVKGHELLFHVKDTGIGIAVENQEYIFNRFRQGEESFSRKYGGTGLGLSISRGLVNLLGGRIWVRSEPDNGSTFYFTHPFVAATDENLERLQKEQSGYNWSRKLILIVEDVYNNYKYLSEVLKTTQAKVLHAYDGDEAIDIFRKNPTIDLVLMDIQLPGISGFDITTKILAINPNVPVIAQTAHAFDQDRDKALEHGCIDYIAKPIKKKDLLDLLDKYIG